MKLSESDKNHLQLKKFFDRKVYRLLIFSDPHGWLADLRALRCINKVLQSDWFDEVCIAGDLVDLPYLSKHARRLFSEGILNNYSEEGELEYTREQILAPLRASHNGLITFVPGNHDERLTKPFLLTKSQAAKVAELYKNYGSFQKMAGFDKYGIQWDGSDTLDYFNVFTIVHGLSLSDNTPDKNIQEYMGSGASGHTHRLRNKYKTNRHSQYVWFETGCTRIREEVEYLPTGRIANWQHGFVTIDFYKQGDQTYFFGETHIIVDGMTKYNGVIYNGNKR